MEAEAFFLFVAYLKSAHLCKVENGKEVLYQPISVKRAVLKKPERNDGPDGFTYKRVNVEFDPTSKQMAYVAIVHAYVDDGPRRVVKDKHYFAVAENEEEIENVKREIEQTRAKSFLEKGLKFDTVEILPVLVAEY